MFCNVFLSISILVFISNLVNSYFDFINKIDDSSHSKDRTMFDYGLTKSELLNFIRFSFVAYIVSFYLLYLNLPEELRHQVFYWNLVPYFSMATFIALSYTCPPFQFKYHGLGEMCALFGYGSIMPLFYYTQTFELNWKIFGFSIPYILACISFIHANNLRDLEVDKKIKIKTLAMILGKTNSRYFYLILNLG
eukprot:gene783-974_t